ncbi:DNRLRE domain-containing protein [Nonomuraea bangladeshensis]|uniref:DNRLRE domain-containing protein n=1 Tax=Nonomuraea bangladeshensis TaxID=404385 RepID=A0ABV3HA11_9ACTN
MIRQRPAEDLTFSIPVHLPKGTKFRTGAKPALLDSKGKQIDNLSAALMTDAAAANNPDAGKIGQAAIRVDGSTAVIIADADFLADPAVTYPVTVETSSEEWVGTGIDGDTHVSQVRPDGQLNNSLTWMHAGRSHSGAQTHRAYYRFNIHGTPLEGGTVSNADFRIFNYNSHDCSDTANPGIELRQIIGEWSMQSLTWSKQPSTTINGHVGNKGAYDVDCPEGEGELYYSIEQIVQEWMNGAPDRGIRLGSPIETEAQNWRTYRSYEYGGYDTYPFTPRGPVLFIEYEPGIVKQEVVVPIAYTGPDQDEPLTYAEAMAQRLETSESAPPAPTITLDQAQQLGEQTSDTHEVPSDDLLPLPEEEPEANDVTPPTVIETTPAGGAVSIGTDTTIQTVFDEPVSGTVLTLKDPAGTPVQGASESAGEDRVTIFTPAQALAPQTTYTAEVSGSRDTAGNTLAAPYTWSFTRGVGGTPTPDPTDPPPVTQTVTLPLRTDTWIDNQGGVGPASPTLWVGVYGDTDLRAVERTYLNFDTSAIADKTVVSADLKLWNSGSYGCGGSGAGIKVQRVTSAWQADALRWTNQPSVVSNGEAIARDPDGCTDGVPSNSAWTWSLTGIAQAWASGQANHGIMLRGSDESATAPEYDRGYHAAENDGDDPHPPVLTVTYVTGGGPSPTPDPTTPPPGSDTTPPTVVSVSPADGAEDVPGDAKVKVTFSEPVTGAQLTMLNLFESESVPGQASMSANNTVLTFTPSILLDSWYWLEVTDAKDSAGNTLEPYAWMFANSGWTSARSQSRSVQAAADEKPSIERLWTRPFTTEKEQRVISTLRPDFHVKVSDPLRRRSVVSIEVEHDPDAREQGAGMIWSGSSAPVSSGATATVSIPEGKLADGWRVRWRSRATAMGVAGAWSEWQSLLIRLPQSGKTSSKTEERKAVDAQAVPKTFPYNRVSWDQCWADSLAGQVRGRGNGTLSAGHSSNVYNWCAFAKMRWPVYEVTVDARTGAITSEKYVGQVKFRFSTRLYTHAGSGSTARNPEKDASSGLHGRDMLFRWRVDQIKWEGTNSTYYNAQTLRVGIAVSDKCKITAGPGVSGNHAGKEQPWRTWQADAEAEWTIHSPKNLGEGRHALSSCMIAPSASYTSPLTNVTPSGNFTEFLVQSPVVRCDTSPLITKYTGGCILIDVNPVLVFDATVKIGIRQSAKHVWDAYFHADTWTKPTINEPKKIPGRTPNGRLHRITEGAVPGLEDPDEAPTGTIRANRRNSIRQCEQLWPTVNPEPDGLDCDEFPFASTREGSLAAHGHYSVRYINNGDNRSSGNDLGPFYERQRRLAGDAFWVYPKPVAGDENLPPVR